MMGKWMNGWVDGWMTRWVNGWLMDSWKHGWWLDCGLMMDGWMNDDGWIYIFPPVIHLTWRVTMKTSTDIKGKRHMVRWDQRVLCHVWSFCSSSRPHITDSSLPPRCLHACPGNREPVCDRWCQRCFGWIPEILKPETSCRSCWKKTQNHWKMKFLFPELSGYRKDHKRITNAAKPELCRAPWL